jgi:hypothetical protein
MTRPSLPGSSVSGYPALVDDHRLETIRAIRERLAADRPQLSKALVAAHMRCEAVLLDAIATLQRCRAAQVRRAAHLQRDNFESTGPARARENGTD